ncbi:alpha-tocopherol transfer protein-like [Amyelois transitella]|uniref:alpha-tocopherol transfer protein-like n=1 Tax=Amyelois transitella TaxID=680683 RepID=UPI00067D150C|nr:alpha-tocopherol transfer protein-like [Amyelois transitella]XP_013184165.1 alpha-tocopherol transfer protein-like [Amyelois transitella]
MTLEQPTGEMWQKIREELNENADTKDADLAHIKEWLKKEPHLPDEWDDQRIMTFLRGCKFSLEKTKRKLDMYFTMRTAVPEFFTDRDVKRPELQEILNMVQMPPLPGLTPDGRRVIIMRGLDKDVQTPNVADAFKLALMMGDVRLAEEKEGVAGDVYILDASVATPTHFSKFTPTLVKKFLVCVQEAYPVKLKAVHVINISPLVDKIVNFVKPFIKDKIKERIFLHSDSSELYKYVPKEMLPNEYGGNAGSMADLHSAWVKKMDEYTDWFKQQEDVKANEALRPGKPTNYDELFGIDGSFRQLVID